MPDCTKISHNHQGRLSVALDYARRGLAVFPLHTPLHDHPQGHLCTCEAYRHSDLCRERDAERQRRPPAQPAAPDWREALTVALKEGKASPKEVLSLIQRVPEQKPAEPGKWTLIETVVAIYKEHGHRYESQAFFVMHLANKGIPISVPTFQRWLREWERCTGEQVRPGRGSRKRRSM